MKLIAILPQKKLIQRKFIHLTYLHICEPLSRKIPSVSLPEYHCQWESYIKKTHVMNVFSFHSSKPGQKLQSAEPSRRILNSSNVLQLRPVLATVEHHLLILYIEEKVPRLEIRQIMGYWLHGCLWRDLRSFNGLFWVPQGINRSQAEEEGWGDGGLEKRGWTDDSVRAQPRGPKCRQPGMKHKKDTKDKCHECSS